MAGSSSARSLQARLRLRELAQYYSTTASLPPADFDPRRDIDGTVRPYDLADFQPYSPALSQDPSLTAIAQLAAVRTNCQRSFISLIGESAQHVVAEATRTVSPFDKDDFEGDDGIILGAQSIPLTFGICTTTIGVFTGKCDFVFGADTEVHDDYICIPDLLAEDNTSSLPAIQALPPILRFYMEVPLKSEGGYVIGSICVMDPSVRSANARDVKVLQDMSKLIMRHIELTRMREDHRRAERLLAGLGHFIKGKDSFKDRSEHGVEESETSRQDVRPSQNSTGSLSNDGVESARSASTKNLELDPTASPPDPVTSKGPMTVNHELSVAAPRPQSRTTDVDTTENTKDYTDAVSSKNSVEMRSSNNPAAPNSISSDIKHTFSRASNLIRESIDLCACCFLEIPKDKRYTTTKFREDIWQSRQNGINQNVRPPSSCESSYESDTENSSRKTSKSQDPANDANMEMLCEPLGFSTRSNSSLVGTSTTNTYLTLPVDLVRRLCSKYPKGRIFHFDSTGSVSSESDEQKIESGTEAVSRPKKLSSKLLQYFPTARSLMFFPMYDNDNQQVFAAYFGYTTNAARGLQKSELTYVSGFTNSIMCEILRLRSEATNKAKSDFISSISHELRSPLHGILASSQLLLEDQTLPKQGEFLETIDVCARTLLDIMNHLLDYAKINHFTKQPDPKSRMTLAKRANSDHTLVTDLNLINVVEETASSMEAGSSLNSWQQNKFNNHATSSSNYPVVPIILNITPHENWSFSSEPGSWRRIIMNLVGNSLKYTQQGHIEVRLSIQDASTTVKKQIVMLKVSDTGQGISAEYLKHKLYTPFAQENNLSVGVGLGLSLVRQIVSALSGQITISSEVGVGTEVTIAIPLEPCHTVPDDQFGMDSSKSLLKGLNVRYVGFNGTTAHMKQSNGAPDTRTDALIAMKRSLALFLERWLGATASTTNADITVVEETYLERELDLFDAVNNVLLVVRMNKRTGANIEIRNAIFAYVSPPIGPIRMTHIIKALLAQREQKGVNIVVGRAQADKVLSTPIPVAPVDLDTKTVNKPTMNSAMSASPVETNGTTRHQEPAYSAATNHVTKPKEAILLVDDNSINLRILLTAISRLKYEAHGIQVLTAVNGLEALNAYKTATNAGTCVRVVLMDISMPVMDGITATKEIRLFEQARGMPENRKSVVIAVTGLASAEAQHEIENSGFDDYLPKPVHLKVLREALGNHMADVVSK
ncbi:hypothetical protein LTR05_008009 [Lithohypha guttulata]|uniref:histidine kinase n=1 Tax=Lithohypha guttulata TaxID=1690604 RepID=A0AAN7Y8L2_9EURO|nr:hypothetical protein LTR05_008009 [Lithohypha guttulata]